MNLSTKLASALLAMRGEDGAFLVPYEDAKLMSADQIISLFQFDHYPIRKADGGPDAPWNLVPRFILAHREKTAKKDAPEMAKDRSIAAAHANHVDRIQAKIGGRPIQEPPRSARKMQSRPFPKMQRHMGKRKAWMQP